MCTFLSDDKLWQKNSPTQQQELEVEVELSELEIEVAENRNLKSKIKICKEKILGLQDFATQSENAFLFTQLQEIINILK